MKINRLFVLMLWALFVSISTGVLAQSAPSPVSRETFADAATRVGLPIRNMGVLRAYAEASAARGSEQISHPGIIPDRYAYFDTGNNPLVGADAVLQALRSKNFAFELGSVEGGVGVSVNLYNRSGLELLRAYGQTSWLPRFDGGVWLDRNFIIKLEMVPVVPIKVVGLIEARATLHGADGALVFDQSLRVDNGHLAYPTNLLERTGEIYLKFREIDGTEVTEVFNAGGGAVKSPQPAHGGVPVYVDGDYDFGTNPSGIELLGVNLRDAIVRFGIDLDPSSSLNFAVGGKSALGEVPIGILFRKTPAFATDGWVFYPITGGHSFIALFSGHYELVYVLDPADLEGVPLLPPDYYGDPGDVKGSTKPPQL